MKIISIFNNKGGVGKTTLTFHLASILAEMEYKVLILDLDSQCNISLYGMQEEELEEIWNAEDEIIENGFSSDKDFSNLLHSTRTTHFLLKSVEQGISDFEELPPPFKVKFTDNLDLIPGRLTLFKYEDKIAERWSAMYLGDPLAIRTVTKIRKIAEAYSAKNNYDFVIIDTSPNLGILNKVIISTVDGFIIPCLPDMFSLYGIKNIGKALTQWRREFAVCYSIISEDKRSEFPRKEVRFLGYTVYNARQSPNKNYNGLSKIHHSYAIEIPNAIRDNIDKRIYQHLKTGMLEEPIGKDSVTRSHDTFPAMAQKYKVPMWKVVENSEEKEESSTIARHRESYLNTREKYKEFAEDFLARLATLDE
jgi:cellulose biosynthesis protein BcsQ